MKGDVILTGVGGQHTLSLGFLFGAAARADGLHVMLSEVHGMAQRGGSVVAHLRIRDSAIHSPLISARGADVLLSTEPLEALRALPLLAPEGTLMTAVDPHRNIPNYPSDDELQARLSALPRLRLVKAEALARQAGAVDAGYLVLAGAASHILPVRPESLELLIGEVSDRAGAVSGTARLAAFRAGRKQPPCLRF